MRSRLIWDQAHPNDPVQTQEVVHHINGVKDDDRLENLMKLPSQAAHARLHQTGKTKSADERARIAASNRRTKALRRVS